MFPKGALGVVKMDFNQIIGTSVGEAIEIYRVMPASLPKIAYEAEIAEKSSVFVSALWSKGFRSIDQALPISKLCTVLKVGVIGRLWRRLMAPRNVPLVKIS